MTKNSTSENEFGLSLKNFFKYNTVTGLAFMLIFLSIFVFGRLTDQMYIESLGFILSITVTLVLFIDTILLGIIYYSDKVTSKFTQKYRVKNVLMNKKVYYFILSGLLISSILGIFSLYIISLEVMAGIITILTTLFFYLILN